MKMFALLFLGSQSQSELFNLRLLLLLISPTFFCSSTTAEESGRKIKTLFNISIPDTARFNPERDEYVCTVKQLNLTEKAVYLEEFVYSFSKHGSAHHFLLYGCESVAKYALDNAYWSCNAKGKSGLCSKRKHIPLGIPQTNSKRNPKVNVEAPAKFPNNVAYGVGPQFGINYLMLEVHFMPVKEGHDHGDVHTNGEGEGSQSGSENKYYAPVRRNYSSGIVAHGSTSRPTYFAGMMVMAGVGFVIPHGQKNFSVDMNCQPELSQPIYPYAYWVHTHDLGQVVSGYRVNRTSGQFTEFAKWSHRRPQPVILDLKLSKSTFAIYPGDFVAGKCVYDSSDSVFDVHWGPRHGLDEMCNLFLFYFTLSPNPKDLSISCVNEQSKIISKRFPPEAFVLPEISTPSPLSALPMCHDKATAYDV